MRMNALTTQEIFILIHSPLIKKKKKIEYIFGKYLPSLGIQPRYMTSLLKREEQVT